MEAAVKKSSPGEEAAKKAEQERVAAKDPSLVEGKKSMEAVKLSPLDPQMYAPSSESDDEEAAEEENEEEPAAVKPSPLNPLKYDSSSQSEESDDEEESEEEEEEGVAVEPSPLNPLKYDSSSQSEESDDEEESEEEESEEEEEEGVAVEPSPLNLNMSAPSSESEESDDEEEAEEEEKENEPVPKPTDTKPKIKEEVFFKQVNEHEYESAKKKQKIDASPSQSSGKFARIFSYEDELALMQALLQFHCEHGRLPNQKEYGLFHSSLKNLNPVIQETQVRNKIRAFKDAYSAWKRRGTVPFPPSNPNAEALFEISRKLWGENVQVPMKGEEIVHDKEIVYEEVVEAENTNGTNTINGEQNVKNESEFPYAMDAIKELAQNDRGMLLYLKSSFNMMENSKAVEFEAELKEVKYNQAKVTVEKLKLTSMLAKELIYHASQ